jgi:hypothetical protein
MNESNADPAFEVRRLKSAPGWYVRVAWAHGKRDHIPGFISEQEAQRWIETKAPPDTLNSRADALCPIAGLDPAILAVPRRRTVSIPEQAAATLPKYRLLRIAGTESAQSM